MPSSNKGMLHTLSGVTSLKSATALVLAADAWRQASFLAIQCLKKACTYYI